MIKFAKSSKKIFVITFLFFGFFACKELPPPKIPKESGERFSHIPMPLSPAPPATTEPTVSTEEMSVTVIQEETPVTEESAISSAEEETPTEVFGETTEETTVEEKVVYAKMGASLFDSKGARRKAIAVLKPGEKLVVTDEGGEGAWIEIKFGEKRGFIRREQVCASALCVEKQRAGVVPVYRESRDVLTPQIKVVVSNLTGIPISIFRMNAKFYYKGNYIGEDEAYVAAEVIGVKGLNNGDSAAVYFRPYFELPLDAVISPDNPVKVEMLCAVESETFVSCGEIVIDDMLY